MREKLKDIYYFCIRGYNTFKYNFQFYWEKVFNKDHVAYAEVWNLNNYLAAWILPRIHHLKKYKHVYPIDLTFDSWMYILGEIEFACVFMIYDAWDEKTKLERKLVKELILEPFGDVREYLEWKGDKLKVDKQKKAVYHGLYKRMKKGFRLLGKHYLSLWD
jgi:hypothetical protein